MTRNVHNRQRDHYGSDLDTNIVIDGAIGGYADGTSLHEVLDGHQVLQSGSVEIYIGPGVPTGLAGWVEMPFAGTITGVTILSDVIGDCVFDIWKCAYADFPTTSADSIVAATPPTLTNDTKSKDTTLSYWDTSFVAGDILTVSVTSSSQIEQVVLSISFSRSV